VSWEVASANCDAAGARLCTVGELLTVGAAAFGAQGDGACGYGSRLAWSSTECGGKGQEVGRFAASGAPDAVEATTCAPLAGQSKASHVAVCCADADDSAPPRAAALPSDVLERDLAYSFDFTESEVPTKMPVAAPAPDMHDWSMSYMAPVPAPTMGNTLVSASFSIVATEECSVAGDAVVKAQLAAALDLPEAAFANFMVTCNAAARRALLQTSYVWEVSFALRIDLADTGAATATEFTYLVISSIANAAPALSAALGFEVTVEDVASAPVVNTPFMCYLSDCGCPGSFMETWCSKDSALITAGWCNMEEANCEGSCGGTACYPDMTPTAAPVEMECFISQCGCPDAFAHSWCSEATAKITSEWCAASESNCAGHCSGSYCEAGLVPADVEVVAPLSDCYISQCGCPGSFLQTWCMEANAKVTSPWCGENEGNCGSCGGTYCLI
jgi:hypothetical protein